MNTEARVEVGVVGGGVVLQSGWTFVSKSVYNRGTGPWVLSCSAHIRIVWVKEKNMRQKRDLGGCPSLTQYMSADVQALAKRDPFRDRSFATFARISAQRGGLGGMGGSLRKNYMLWEAHGTREISNGATWLRSIAGVPGPTSIPLRTFRGDSVQPVRYYE